MNLPGYDGWKLREDEQHDAPDDQERVRCDWCDEWLEDGAGERIAWMYGHRLCRRKHDDILAHGLMVELRSDERRDDQ